MAADPMRQGERPGPHAVDGLGRRLCGARTRSGGPCKQPAMVGQARCRMHGGASQQARTAAARRVAEDSARRELARMAVVPVDDPVEELAHVVGEIVGWKDTLRARVVKLEQLDYSDYVGIERLRALVDAYGAALDRAERALARMANLGIAERRQQLAEDQASAVAVALRTALDVLQLEAGQRQRVFEVFMTSLRGQAEAAGAVPPARQIVSTS